MKLFAIFISLSFLFACSAPKYGIKNKWVFTIDRFRGNIQVDEQGNPVSKGVVTETIIYLETKPTDSISWQRAIINGADYNVTAATQVSSPANPGVPKKGLDPILIIESAGKNKLYRLVLTPADQNFVDSDPSAARKVTLSGKKNGKPISLTFLAKATQLLSQQVP